MSMILHLAITDELLERARSVRERVFTIEKQIPSSVEVDELDCLNDVCDHFFVELIQQSVGVSEGTTEDDMLVGIERNKLEQGAKKGIDICALRCKKIDAKQVQLQRFCVTKDYRKHGVGRWTLEQVEAYYWKQGFEWITLDAKFHVSRFYEKCGYIVVSEPFMEAGVEHVVMEKRRKQK